MNVPLSDASLTEEEKKILLNVFRRKRLALGSFLNKFEEKMKEYFNVDYAVAVNSGTSALHLILRSLGIKENEGMIVTPFTFIASSNVAMFERAHPVFIDIDPENYNIDIEKIELTLNDIDHPLWKRIKGLKDITFFMGVDIFGQPLDWDRFFELNKKYNWKVVEDSCEAIGAKYKDRMVGTLGEAGTFAFYPNKQITTGEGGMIITNNEEIAKLSRSMANQGRGDSYEWLEHVRLGYNYRMDELSAALGYVQMKRLDEILEKRENVAKNYYELFKEEDRVILPHVEEYTTKPSWFVFVVRLSLDWISNFIDIPEYMKSFDLPLYIPDNEREFWKSKVLEIREITYDIIKQLNAVGIQAKNYFSPVHLQKFYRDLYGYEYGDYPVTELISSLTIAIPFYTELDFEKQQYVVENFRNILNNY
ncbi:polysaccharide biosynthesis protein [Marinitoga sp. 1135]|uniref:Putative PLP-dependent enzyme possibly involved in cell wall biogenesis n=1 Tax=Marinitoga piezophila (strain DSM 14283 / JCM 11233 / KA3) TaxID=443254 RepID=H2J3D1_MARPK|nr:MULTISPECIES: DegT/DnrJ/EryC1/StrS family aminotransferase [Marinitoga]AEX85747.1 putative PLP-dependent enzyme possibly involved in cell wall biogenesis [Marinitoga piezophila KA3]NUU95951.1 polysaccharide biosynthesis protein [Marinitoga sp. 1135]